MADLKIIVKKGQSADDVAEEYTLSRAYGVALLRLNNIDPTFQPNTPLPVGMQITIPATWIKQDSAQSPAQSMLGLSGVLVLGGIGLGLMFLMGRGK